MVITEFFYTMGLWNWVLLGFVLLFLELLLPGVFFIWFGLAALVTAAVAALTGSYLAFFADWQGQLVLFLLSSIALVFKGSSFSLHKTRTDALFLNRRTDEMIGLTSTLNEPIRNNHGYIHLNDTIWRVTGPDMPKGSRVLVIGFNNGAFEVTADNPQQDCS
jgi:membrane protein implicated in regulation of membrane protease activity